MHKMMQIGDKLTLKMKREKLPNFLKQLFRDSPI